MTVIESGPLKKMAAQLDERGNVDYQLCIGEQRLALNPLLGKKLTLHFNGKIHCCHCGRVTRKSYAQGFCFPCMQTLAQCDLCIMKPESCHFEKGTCREPAWGEQHCFMPHYVYLANTSGLKVGITRHTQVPTRWIDQGATQALPIFKVSTRLQSGLLEVAMAKFVADKTNWRAMLKGDVKAIDLQQHAQQLIPKIRETLAELQLKYGHDCVEQLSPPVVELRYPVIAYLAKINAMNFDKTPSVGGTLLGIKGQYLLFDVGVINIRKFSAYQVSAEYN